MLKIDLFSLPETRNCFFKLQQHTNSDRYIKILLSVKIIVAPNPLQRPIQTPKNGWLPWLRANTSITDKLSQYF